MNEKVICFNGKNTLRVSPNWVIKISIQINTSPVTVYTTRNRKEIILQNTDDINSWLVNQFSGLADVAKINTEISKATGAYPLYMTGIRSIEFLG
jgi:hypothetical protein